MARKHEIDEALIGKLNASERRQIIERELGRAVADHGGMLHDQSLWGYGELMLAFGLSRNAAREMLLSVSLHPGCRGRIRITKHEYFVLGSDLRTYLERTCQPAADGLAVAG